MPALGDWRVTLFALLILAGAFADAWYFHAFDKQTDLTLILAVAGAVGIAVGHTAGSNSSGPQPPPIV